MSSYKLTQRVTKYVHKGMYFTIGNMKRNVSLTLILPWHHMAVGCVGNFSDKSASFIFKAHSLNSEASVFQR